MPVTARPGREGRTGRASVVLLDPDPYLALLIRTGVPGVDVVEVSPDEDLGSLLSAEPDLVVIDVENRRLPQVLLHRDTIRILAIGRPGRPTVPATEVDAVVMRPFVSRELQQTVAGLVGLQTRGPEAGWYARFESWVGPARVAAVALAAVLSIGNPDPMGSVLLAVGFLWTGARLRVLRRERLGVWLDVLVATTLVALSGGMDSNYFALALVVAVGSGLTLGPQEGSLAGLFLSLAAVPELLVRIGDGTGGEPRQLVAWMLLYPLASLAGGQAGRLWGTEGRWASRTMLVDAHRALSDLYRLAQTMPRGLTVGTVVGAVLEELEQSQGALAGVLFIEDAGILLEVGAFGLVEHARVFMEGDEPEATILDAPGVTVVDADDLPGSLGRHATAVHAWVVAPLRHAGSRVGALVIGLREQPGGRARRAIAELAGETSLAVTNARLFGRVRELAVDEERLRLAADLHDGVAQSLAHVRLELEFLARNGRSMGEHERSEVSRLAHTADRALADVRGTIGDLRNTVNAEGLAESLRDYCLDLRGLTGTEIRFHGRSGSRLDLEVETALFRIARTAIATALRRAGVEEVDVSLEDHDAGGVVLRVDDDGHDWGPHDNRAASKDVARRAIAERAAEIGATVESRETPVRGSRLTVTYGAGGQDRPGDHTVRARSS